MREAVNNEATNFVLNQMVDTEINSDDTINSIRSESIDIKVLVLSGV